MKSKPISLGPAYADQFKDQAVAEVYRKRPSYPDATFLKLAELMPADHRTILDLGAGTVYRCPEILSARFAGAYVVHCTQCRMLDSVRLFGHHYLRNAGEFRVGSRPVGAATMTERWR